MPFSNPLKSLRFSGFSRRAATLSILLSTSFLWVLPARATQDGWPALFDVTGVAESDVLNVRGAPAATSEIVGAFAHDAEMLEVISENEEGTWGQVNVGEQTGWVALRFLARRPGNLDGLFPDYQSCFGTEPFWSLARAEGTLTLDVAFDDKPAIAELVDWETGTLSHRGRFSFATPNMTGFIARQACNDGMSDREFGLEINLILRNEKIHLQGCCSLLP